MEAGLELEDDVFFKDLSRQISLLIMDDDGDDDYSLAHSPSVNLQGFNPAALIRPAAQASFLNYEHQCPSSKRESKGTGVFIPRSSNPRRKNGKQGRTFTGSATYKSHRPSDHNSRGLINPHYSNNINPSHDHYSFNLRRF